MGQKQAEAVKGEEEVVLPAKKGFFQVEYALMLGYVFLLSYLYM